MLLVGVHADTMKVVCGAVAAYDLVLGERVIRCPEQGRPRITEVIMCKK